jgi:hypothetical protein
MEIQNYRFQAKWKEELVCSTNGKQFVLEFPMGTPTVYLPTKSRWSAISPAWASNHWDDLYDQLSTWCEANDVQLTVSETARVDV